MTESSNAIASIFSPTKIPQYQPPTLMMSSTTRLKPIDEPPKECDEDFEYARKSTITAIETAKTALTDLVSLASASQHPKVYEQLTALIQTIVGSSGQLLSLQRQNSYNRGGAPEAPKTTTNNNLFVGSTTELAGVLAKLKEQNGG